MISSALAVGKGGTRSWPLKRLFWLIGDGFPVVLELRQSFQIGRRQQVCSNGQSLKLRKALEPRGRNENSAWETAKFRKSIRVHQIGKHDTCYVQEMAALHDLPSLGIACPILMKVGPRSVRICTNCWARFGELASTGPGPLAVGPWHDVWQNGPASQLPVCKSNKRLTSGDPQWFWTSLLEKEKHHGKSVSETRWNKIKKTPPAVIRCI